MSLDRFCRKPLVTARPDKTVLEVAKEMEQLHVGSVIVVDAEQKPVGLLTDRDVVCRVVAKRLDPASVPVAEVMSRNVGTARANDLIDEVAFRMRQKGVRRMPVVDEQGRAVGMVTLDDLLVLFSAELGQTAAVIRANRGP
jgi:CBS domain-containing protein